MSKVTDMKNKARTLGLAVFLAVSVAGCAAQGGGAPPSQADSLNTAPQGSTILWHSGVQFVALTPQGDGASPNQQPADLTPTQVRQALAELKVARGSQSATAPVFTDAALQELSPKLAAALSKAGQHQDATFAVASKGESADTHMLLIHINQPLVTTGRVFYRNGRLNVIFGLINQPFETEYAKTGRLPPMPPGSRARRVQSGWRVTGGQAVEHPASGREDWVSVALARTKPVAKSERAVGSSKPATQEGSAGGAKSPVESEYDRIARRLRVLDKLHRQGLITDQEYRAKRKQILSGL